LVQSVALPTTGANGAHALIASGTASSEGLLSRSADGRFLVLTGYDIVAQSLDAIRDGRQAFTIDQQQFWRGYMPVLLLTHYLKYGLIEGNYFLTGPTVVDKSNVEQVAKLVKAGYR